MIPFIQKLNVWMFILMAFAFPLYKPLITYLIGLWCLSWILELNFKNRFTTLKNNRFIFFVSILFYVLHIVSLFYTQHMSRGWFDLEVKLSLLIFPLFCIGLNKLYKVHFNKILLAFVFGNIFASIICIIGALYHSIYFIKGHLSFSTGFNGADANTSNFFYTNFSFFHHTSYFSMYLVFATVICCYFIFERNEISKKIKNLFLFSIVFFTIMIFFLSSRAAFLTEIIVVGGLFLQYSSRIKTAYLRIILVSVIVFCVAFIYTNPRFGMLKATYFANYYSNEKKSDILTDESALSRLGIWKSSFPIIKNNMLLGVGSGDVTDELIVYYKKNNNLYALAQRLNAHNQFIETFLGVGFAGIILLLSMLLWSFYQGFHKKHYLLIFFLVIVCVNFVFESMLNTQAGVIFFAFFFNFLNYVDQEKSTSDV